MNEKDIKYQDELNKLYRIHEIGRIKGDAQLMHIAHREIDNLMYKRSKGEV